jgi:hypothetical protein
MVLFEIHCVVFGLHFHRKRIAQILFHQFVVDIIQYNMIYIYICIICQYEMNALVCSK